MTADGTCPHAAREDPLGSLLDSWVTALAGPHPGPALRRRLAPLATSLLDVAGGRATLPIARAVGAALVTAGLDEPVALERTLVMLQRELADHPRGPDLIAGLAAGYVGAVRELTAHDRSAAARDPLTGLPTRAVLADKLQIALDGPAGRRVGLCALDLDGFRGVNDTLGHDAGDALLRAVARRLTADLGPDGHLVARAGGDEFVVLAVDVDGDTLRALAGRALAAVAKPFELGGHRVVVTATAGIVPGDGRGLADAGALLQAADTTLNRAKRHGRGGVAEFEPRLHRRAVSRFALAARMADALTAGEFSLEYQPLVRLADGVPVGVEALVRWDLPSGERIEPDRFVPVAEETGHIVPLGRWVLTQACRQAKTWPTARDRAPLLLSVNLAARQIREPGIVADIAGVLAETGRPAASLQVELTESDAMGGSTSLSTLRAIADMGVRIAIDDFGTGYSNLAYLRRLPVQTIKLAAPFVSGPDGDDVDIEIAATLIRLAHSLGMTVVAEAIETAEQSAQLRALGCDIGQGYFFSPPLPPDAIAERLA